jgi:hypothetical protein
MVEICNLDAMLRGILFIFIMTVVDNIFDKLQ